MHNNKHILVMRFSAMGDVAMTVPVVKAVLAQNPGLEITYASRPAFRAMFNDIPRLSYFPIDFKKEYKGVVGLWKLFTSLKKLRIDGIADLHSNLRTKILSNFFSASAKPIVHVNKGRKEKKRAIRLKNKELKPLKPMTERYADVFRKLGFKITLDNLLKRADVIEIPKVVTLTGEKSQRWIGISPFAQHKGKVYPLDKMEEVIQTLNGREIKIFLFGGGHEEQIICEEWEKKFENVISTVHRLSLEEELQLITELDVMLSMDSAGMHLASMQGVPVVSVWGSTHHYLGFLGYGQTEENIVADSIGCRPCSVYGNTPCFRPERDFACLNRINPQTIVEKLNPYLSSSNQSEGNRN